MNGYRVREAVVDRFVSSFQIFWTPESPSTVQPGRVCLLNTSACQTFFLSNVVNGHWLNCCRMMDVLTFGIAFELRR